MNFGNLEKIESVLLRPIKGFVLKNVVQFGKRGTKGQRLDAFGSWGYKSNKYDNIDYVGMDVIETSDYLVLEYNDKTEKKKTEIYLSYLHFYKFRRKLGELIEIFKKNTVFKLVDDTTYIITSDWDNFYIKISGLVGNKSIGLYFDTYEEEDVDGNINSQPSITFLLNDESVAVNIPLSIVIEMYEFLCDFNLLTSSQNLMQLAYLNEMSRALKLENEPHKIKSEYVDYNNLGGEIIKTENRIKKRTISPVVKNNSVKEGTIENDNDQWDPNEIPF